MRLRTVIAALAGAALLAPATPVHADDAYFKYYKWRGLLGLNLWYLEEITDCKTDGELFCNQHGYEHDDYGEIEGHQQGESWDCKYPMAFDGHGVPEPRPVRDAQEAARSVLRSVETLPTIASSRRVYWDPDGPPPCPGSIEDVAAE